MRLNGAVERDIREVRLPRWGSVIQTEGVVPFLVIDAGGVPVVPIRRFLTDFVAQGNSPRSVRSYAYTLLRWWRWLLAVEVGWDMAAPAECRDLLLWMGFHAKTRTSPRTKSRSTMGTINPITRKRYLDDRYAARTIRHSNAVVRSFYEFWIEIGEGPLLNPVPLSRRGAQPNAHHNPLVPFRAGGRLRYSPKLPKQRPREIPDPQWQQLFAALRHSRDRALLSLTVSTAARSAEILGLRPVDLDWGEQLVRVTRKGSGASQWLPASAEAFVWLRIWIAELGMPMQANHPLWQTIRRRDHGDGLRRQPLTYEALRKVLTRANEVLGTNWSMHDLRHTAALRMARDEHLSERDVQTILGHAHLSTTAEIYLVQDEAETITRIRRHLAERADPARPLPVPAPGYDDHDLSVLFGGGL
ncbi:tyrosine-type recombinase/integrase [Nocardia jejuensis]|uniref:tyrosine-type recombinase/integrase n=1 Tax=Nocardia jejuensis TaxID=328049 RepID=UPI000829FD26|nr:site-specific integrase [Nocardia jejuensis]